MPTNEERADSAYRAALYFGQGQGDYSNDELITDLICNLLHCAKDYGDPAAMLRSAVTNYVAEKEDETGTLLYPDIAPFVREAFEQVL